MIRRPLHRRAEASHSRKIPRLIVAHGQDHGRRPHSMFSVYILEIGVAEEFWSQRPKLSRARSLGMLDGIGDQAQLVHDRQDGSVSRSKLRCSAYHFFTSSSL